MPDLLLELFSEEIPARMQRRAAEDLKKLVTDALVERGFLYEGAKAYATPRRLALHVVGLPPKGKDVREERKGPKVGAPENAVQGFLRSAGLASLDQARIEKDPKKGDFYVAVTERPGRPTPEVLAEVLPGIVKSFPWPKSMRWGAASAEPGSLRWVRPLHSIVCTFGPETETPEVVPLNVEGISSGDVTRGHRFMAPDPIRVRRFADYVASLERAKVVLDADRRKDVVLNEARNLAFARGLELVEDEGLLEEVAGLVEWPVVLMGAFDEEFLEIPPEVIRATIRANQKCFVLRDAKNLSQRERSSAAGGGDRVRGSALSGEGGTPHPVGSADSTLGSEPEGRLSSSGRGDLSNAFILVANLEAKDGGAAIVAGNERVVRARLSDAKFFWETDRKVPLEDRLEKLKSIVFHEKLGTQHERVERIASLARVIGELIEPQKNVGATQYGGSQASYHNNVQTAAWLAKADLVTEMVGEFPELQGLMGRYYALEQRKHPSIAAAIEEHYKPLGPSDRVPTEPVSVAVALADKIDTLVGFWAIDEKPTGSKDPYALRRAALGVIRLVLENEIRLRILGALDQAGRIQVRQLLTNGAAGYLADSEDESSASILVRYSDDLELSSQPADDEASFLKIIHEEGCVLVDPIRDRRSRNDTQIGQRAGFTDYGPQITSFFADRLKVHLREQGARHDLIDAVFALPGQDDLLMIVRRVEALGRFLDTEDGRNLLAGYRRAANILRIEEKKDARAYDTAPDIGLLRQPEELALREALVREGEAARAAVAREDFEGAMLALSRLRPPVDAFFDKVTVNADDPALRENRLKLLNALRAATREVADFSRIEG